jgi:hypothetical protein
MILRIKGLPRFLNVQVNKNSIILKIMVQTNKQDLA